MECVVFAFVGLEQADPAASMGSSMTYHVRHLDL